MKHCLPDNWRLCFSLVHSRGLGPHGFVSIGGPHMLCKRRTTPTTQKQQPIPPSSARSGVKAPPRTIPRNAPIGDTPATGSPRKTSATQQTLTRKFIAHLRCEGTPSNALRARWLMQRKAAMGTRKQKTHKTQQTLLARSAGVGQLTHHNTARFLNAGPPPTNAVTITPARAWEGHAPSIQPSPGHARSSPATKPLRARNDGWSR